MAGHPLHVSWRKPSSAQKGRLDMRSTAHWDGKSLSTTSRLEAPGAQTPTTLTTRQPADLNTRPRVFQRHLRGRECGFNR